MILCLDIGNSHIFGGVFKDGTLQLQFRHDSNQKSTSDQLGVFLRSILREHKLDPDAVKQVAISSVVPALDYSMRAACVKYFNLEPFLLKAGVKTGLNIKYRNPQEVGADRIANAIAAVERFPNKNVIVVSCGTATTVCGVSKEKAYLGGTILAGIRLCMEALQHNAAKLPPVEIVRAEKASGRSTIEGIQAGLYFGHLGSMREVIARTVTEVFNGEQPIVIGTGGFAHLFEGEKLFTIIVPDLILRGLYLAIGLNSY